MFSLFLFLFYSWKLFGVSLCLYSGLFTTFAEINQIQTIMAIIQGHSVPRKPTALELEVRDQLAIKQAEIDRLKLENEKLKQEINNIKS